MFSLVKKLNRSKKQSRYQLTVSRRVHVIHFEIPIIAWIEFLTESQKQCISCFLDVMLTKWEETTEHTA